MSGFIQGVIWRVSCVLRHTQLTQMMEITLLEEGIYDNEVLLQATNYVSPFLF